MEEGVGSGQAAVIQKHWSRYIDLLSLSLYEQILDRKLVFRDQQNVRHSTTSGHNGLNPGRPSPLVVLDWSGQDTPLVCTPGLTI